MLPLPNEGDEVELKREKVEEKRDESTSLYSQSVPPSVSHFFLRTGELS